MRGVHEGGAARQAGLSVGDKLISANHKSLVNVKHQEAVDIIKEAITAQVPPFTKAQQNLPAQSNNENAY